MRMQLHGALPDPVQTVTGLVREMCGFLSRKCDEGRVLSRNPASSFVRSARSGSPDVSAAVPVLAGHGILWDLTCGGYED
jgi:hypothetical protein